VVDSRQLNLDSVAPREVPAEDANELRALVEEHHRRTGSARAAVMLADWDRALKTFRQIVPIGATPVVEAAAVEADKAPKTAA